MVETGRQVQELCSLYPSQLQQPYAHFNGSTSTCTSQVSARACAALASTTPARPERRGKKDTTTNQWSDKLLPTRSG